ncbi:MAG TPA: acyl-CoA dehydratase activase-related protein [bacterium]|nr:acyl-CoA dehydratase activase-related protein [bacterium]
MKVGIPRALLYHRYGRFWEKFLTGLGVEVVVSRRTDKVLLQNGLGYVSSEVCLPIKIMAGHIEELAGQIDVLFLPRLMWLEDKLYACPKMIGIVDIARMMLAATAPVGQQAATAPVGQRADRVRIVAPKIQGSLWLPHFSAGMELCHDPVRVVRALAAAGRYLPTHGEVPEFPAGEKRIALVGHFYNLGDDFISRPMVDTFTSHGYRICTKDELPETVLRSRLGFARKIRWVYERELYNAFQFLVDKVSGVCMIVSMGCGPDSLVAEFMREEAQERDIPFLQLVIDEHTGTAGIVTRIEAFLELAERRQASVRKTPDSRLKTGRQVRAA